MKFNNTNEAIKAYNELKNDTPKGKRIHYPILFKKALCDGIALGKVVRTVFINKLNFNPSTITRWVAQHDEGLYSIEAAYSVSVKSKSLNEKILNKLNQEICILTKKRDLIKECELLGLSVSQ